jgi:pimeloyl-ACP methyl ester carboxylesterase
MAGIGRPPATVLRGVASAGGLAVAAWLVAHLRSPAVWAWRPGTGTYRRLGPLSVRVAGEGPRVFVLLHGLAGSGEVFGAAYDQLASHGRLAVPDLLGFGRSMDLDRQDFGLGAHLDALDEMLEALGPTDVPVTVAGHSMGGVLALCWAARRPAGIERVVTWGAPLYRDPAEARRHVPRTGWMARLFALESPLAQEACAWMCEHRALAAWLGVLLYPRLPVQLARQGVLHTWPAYRDAMNELVLRADWPAALRALDTAGVPVILAAGRRDRAPVPGRLHELAREHRHVRAIEHPTAGHDLPLADPAWCVRLLLEVDAAIPGSTDADVRGPFTWPGLSGTP